MYTIVSAGYNPEDGEPEVHAQEEPAQTPVPSPAPVYNNNPLFLQQNGDSNAVMTNYGTINITFGKKQGR